MRIVGGRLKGRVIDAPDGKGTRPTVDRVRESMASIVISALGGLDEVRVLDAFAGSGALGLEMLSRGAAHVTAFEKDGRAAACIKGNLRSLKVFPTEYQLLRSDVMASAARGAMPGAPFDLVFLDPPYATPAKDISTMMGSLADHGCLASGCCVLYERDGHAPGIDEPRFELRSSRSFGATALDVLRYSPEPVVADEGESEPGRAQDLEE